MTLRMPVVSQESWNSATLRLLEIGLKRLHGYAIGVGGQTRREANLDQALR